MFYDQFRKKCEKFQRAYKLFPMTVYYFTVAAPPVALTHPAKHKHTHELKCDLHLQFTHKLHINPVVKTSFQIRYF